MIKYIKKIQNSFPLVEVTTRLSLFCLEDSKYIIQQVKFDVYLNVLDLELQTVERRQKVKNMIND